MLPDGEVVDLGGEAARDRRPRPARRLRRLGGDLGIATAITVRILRAPEAVTTLLAAFDTTDDAGAAVSEVVARGILPSAIEMMDALAIEAAERAVHAGYPEAGAC